MTNEEIKAGCLKKEQELLDTYFGNLVHEAAVERQETIGAYTKELPQQIADTYQAYLAELWAQCAPETYKGKPLVLEERKLRELMTEGVREQIDEAYKKATTITLWEKLMQTNHEDVTFYKELLAIYTRDLLMLMRIDFLEEITGKDIQNKAFEE